MCRLEKYVLRLKNDNGIEGEEVVALKNDMWRMGKR